MAPVIDTTAYLDTVCQLLREGHSGVPVPIRGTSMRPFLRDGDTVYLDPLHRPPKNGEILLFRRANGQYVLHRVCRTAPLTMLGDGELRPEPVSQAQLLATVTRCQRKGNMLAPGSFLWWFFAHPWRLMAPLRRPIGKIWHIFKFGRE